MADVNTVVIVGRLTRDFNSSDEREFAYTPNGTARANISLAVNTLQKSGGQWAEVANYINVTIFGKTAENLRPYFTKGKMLAVEGSLRQDRWTDKETGRQRERIYVVAENVQLLSSGNAGGQRSGAVVQNQGYQQNQAQPQNASIQHQSYQPNPVDTGFSSDISSFPDEVPF